MVTESEWCGPPQWASQWRPHRERCEPPAPRCRAKWHQEPNETGQWASGTERWPHQRSRCPCQWACPSGQWARPTRQWVRSSSERARGTVRRRWYDQASERAWCASERACKRRQRSRRARATARGAAHTSFRPTERRYERHDEHTAARAARRSTAQIVVLGCTVRSAGGTGSASRRRSPLPRSPPFGRASGLRAASGTGSSPWRAASRCQPPEWNRTPRHIGPASEGLVSRAQATGTTVFSCTERRGAGAFFFCVQGPDFSTPSSHCAARPSHRHSSPCAIYSHPYRSLPSAHLVTMTFDRPRSSRR